jgi:hypothetical protein
VQLLWQDWEMKFFKLIGEYAYADNLKDNKL